MKGLSILGSTGSVGTNVLRIIDAFPERFRVVGLAAGGNVEKLAEQVARYRPKRVSLATAAGREALAQRADLAGVDVGVGCDGMVDVATHPDTAIVVAAAVGAVGLVPTYRALEAGKDVALANKETLVMAGELMVARAKQSGARLLPIDSEHCALHQCLDGRQPDEVRRLVLTASGGPFRARARDSFASITPAEALNHPTWSMGRKITIDSATLMNKGLEVIEARWLFGIPGEHIEILVHPQSVVHSMVEFVDGTVLAQLGVTDMRLPIQYALSYPERWAAAIPGLDFTKPMRLEFDARPRALPVPRPRLPRARPRRRLPAVLNAANEEAVAAFLAEAIPFTAIPEAIAETMDAHRSVALDSIDTVLAADAWAREACRAALSRHAAARAAS